LIAASDTSCSSAPWSLFVVFLIGLFTLREGLLAFRCDEVDGLYDQVYRELLTYMIADPTTINRAINLLWVAHNLERIADRVTNICERVVYMVTGRMEEMNVSKY